MAEIPIYQKVELPQISSSEDVPAYLEAFTSSFAIFLKPREEALLHACRAVELEHIAVDVVSLPRHEPSYQSLRKSQDLLRYLLYEIEKRCPKGGALRPSSPQELALGRLTSRKFSEISVIRDLELMVRFGWGTAEIWPQEKRVRFVPEASVEADMAREHEKFRSSTERMDSALLNIDQRTLRRSAGLLMDSVRFGTNGTMTYSSAPEIFDEFYKAAIEQSPLILTGGLLPEDWHFGAYSLTDYHIFYHLLQARGLMNSFILHEVASASGLPHAPYNSAILLMKRDELIHAAENIGHLPRQAVEEIIRDLTYNPREVQWTEVTYQPLIPLHPNSFAIVPLVIDGSSFDRNLLALMDRLPWRRAAADHLKAARETEMLHQIEPRLRALGFAVASRVGLGEKTARVSDIDLLTWSADGKCALAASLKWFYGPDSLQEVYNHSQRYRKAIAIHRKAIEYLRSNVATVWKNGRLTPVLSQSAQILPALVTFQDEPLERDRVPDIPTVTLPQFIEAIDRCGGLLEKLYDSLCAISARKGASPTKEEVEKIQMGMYTFEVPVLYF